MPPPRFYHESVSVLFVAILMLLTGWAPANVTASKPPNILFIIFDDWGWQHAGAYGCQWVKTPNFDRIAREGVLFKNAFTSNPKCSPCRASILTGRNTWQLEEASCHGGIFPPKFAVYPDLLESAGYTVGLTGKGWGPGEFKLNGRVRNPAGPSFDQYKTTPPSKAIGPIDYSKNFESFLSARDSSKPFCFWVGFHEPHRPYERDSGVRAGKPLDAIVVPPYLPDVSLVRSDLADYAVEVEYADSHIGRMLTALETSGDIDNTLIMVTSDHGMPFPFVKGQIHEDGFHLPLAMRWGTTIKPNRVVEDFVNVRDLAPTFLEVARMPPHPQITGTSLLNILRSGDSGWIENRDTMLIGKERHDLGRPNDWGYPVRAIRTKDFLYVRNFHPERWPACNPETDFGNCDASPTKELLKLIRGHFFDLSFGLRPQEELYDLSTDPCGVNNVASDLGFGAIVDSLRGKMVALLKDEADPRILGNGAIFDTYKYMGNRAKAYDTWLKEQDEKGLFQVPSSEHDAAQNNSNKGPQKRALKP